MAKWARDDEATSGLLLLVGIDAQADVIAAWTDEQVKAAEDWAGSTHYRASDNAVRVPRRPDFLPEPWQGPGEGTTFGPVETPVLKHSQFSNKEAP